MMKTILCYGDSNTWGYSPHDKYRFGSDLRWTGVLQNKLGDQFRIIEEGLNGRTTVWDDPIERFKNGINYLIPCLESHKPFDLITIMLGTNDLKCRFSVSAYDIAESVGVLIKHIQQSKVGPDETSPTILLMAPPPLAKLGDNEEMFQGGLEKSQLFSKHYRKKALEMGCEFLDTYEFIKTSDLDGIHFEQEEHRKLGEAVAQKIAGIFR
jgi:lysophospholipase L1-like esterase